jgi:hypothetical protein
MKSAAKVFMLLLSVGLFTRCSKSSDPAATSSVSLKMSAATTNGSATINGRVASASGDRVSTTDSIALSNVMVNVRDIKFEFDKGDAHFKEDHFKSDSSYSDNDDTKLKGPFLIDLMNAGAFVDQVITTVNVPNAHYARLKFKLSPSAESGDMNGKSISIKGKIGVTDFVFWHKRDANFGAKFSDSTALATTGGATNLAIHLELDKVLSALNGGVDLSKAVDGNHDGVITIDPNDTDGNKWLADQIMMMLVRHSHCEKRDH